MPHLASLLRETAEEVVSESDIIVAAQKCVGVEVLRGIVKAEQCVIDVNGWRELEALAWGYEGLCW